MKITPSSLPGVLILEPDIYRDARGFFTETYHQKRYGEAGFPQVFVQDNLSYSIQGTLRGLHYQYPNDQSKLVQVLLGEVYDVAVDIRRHSPTWGQWTGIHLRGEEKRQVFVPAGFAHGFCVLSEFALVSYKCTDFYAPRSEGGILWCDPNLAIDWPLKSPILSKKDSRYPVLKDIPGNRLPLYGDK